MRFTVLMILALALPAAGEESLSAMLHRVNTLAAQRHFADAEHLAREAVRAHPGSRDAQLALGNVLLWEGRYDDARAQFARILKNNPNDHDARLGIAQAEYWSGDYRSALRDFNKAGGRAEAKRAIAEIEAASAPGWVAGVGVLDDDQPYRATFGTASLYVFSDPLTKWQLDVADARRSAAGLAATTPFVRASVSSVVGHLKLDGALARQRFGDGTTKALGSVGVQAGSLRYMVERMALLRTASSLVTHPTADVFSVRWSQNENSAVHAEAVRYFDGNSGRGADAFYLRPLGNVAIGGSVAWRDTDESRFINGFYVPYYTPQRLREVRAIVAIPHFHVDAGVGREAVVGTFHPWRAAATYAVPVGRTTLNFSAERAATAFYTANEIRASVAGRF